MTIESIEVAGAVREKDKHLLGLCLNQRQLINKIYETISILSEVNQSISHLVSSTSFKLLSLEIHKCQKSAELIRGYSANSVSMSRLKRDVLEETDIISADLKYIDDLLPTQHSEAASKASWTWPWSTHSIGSTLRGLKASAFR